MWIVAAINTKKAEVLKRELARANKESGDRVHGSGLIGGYHDPARGPTIIANRLAVFDRLWAQNEEKKVNTADIEINITLPNGDVKKGFAFKTTPYDIAKSISNGLAEAVVVSKVVYTSRFEDDQIVACDEDETSNEAVSAATEHGELWDLTRPLIGDCQLQLLKFDDPEAKTVFWHSSGHVLGSALESVFGAYLTIGPPLTSGFYYDCYIGNLTVSEEDVKKIEDKAGEFCKQKHPFLVCLCEC